ncbi:DNA cytosine methyltransferase [Yersinia enterocolitica]|nr:DNA cytosine methyltransferase [Yersinia enterocolitica]
MKNNLNIIDLFSGCGGFGLGAELAGFSSLVAIDIEPTLQSAYKRNFPHTRALTSDISLMDESTWRLILNGENIDGVIGGPPCQGYSRMGHSNKDDPRRSLINDFFRTVNIVRPKFFVMENVEGLLDAKNRHELDNAIAILNDDYKVLDPMVVDASDFGVPTKRRRVMVIGYLPEFFHEISLMDFQSKKYDKVTVKDAIYDLGEPISQNNNPEDFGWNKYRNIKKVSQYALNMRRVPPKGLGDTYFIEQLNKGLTSGYFNTIHTEPVIKRYEELIPGKTDKISKSKKSEWSGFCPTLRAGTGADKGSFQAVRPIHPLQGRVITVREAARLQGFPDWFGFHHTKWHSFRMIGNSVSPLLAKEILNVIKKNLLSINAPVQKAEGE